MKFGIICTHTNPKAFENIKNLGFDGVEFAVNPPESGEEFLKKVPQLKESIDKSGLEALSIGRWGMARIDCDGNIIQSAAEDDKNLIKAAAELGVPVYNCGINYAENKSLKENYEIAINYFKDLTEFAKQINVKIAVYNCHWENYVVSPSEWENILPYVPGLGIKYDPSHSINRTLSYDYYLSEMAEYADKFYHFHIKGALVINGKNFDAPPAGMDAVNWGAVFDVLYKKGYKYNISYEPHSSYWRGKKAKWGIIFSRDYIKKYIVPDDYEDDIPEDYII